jgi:hypothetical protein
MANTYELITGITGQGNPYTVPSGGIASVTLSGIPNTYTDLKLVCSLRTSHTNTSDDFYIRFNSSSSGYTYRGFYGTGSAIGYMSASGASLIYVPFTDSAVNTGSTFASVEFYIPDYASSTDKNVSIDGVTEQNGTLAQAFLNAGVWGNAAAITSINIIPYNAPWVEFSTFSLYGIKKA